MSRLFRVAHEAQMILSASEHSAGGETAVISTPSNSALSASRSNDGTSWTSRRMRKRITVCNCAASMSRSDSSSSYRCSARSPVNSDSRCSNAVTRASRVGFFIEKAFVFVFGTKAQVVGGAGYTPCHCLGRAHRGVIPSANKSTCPCGLTDLRAPVAATVAAREPAGPHVVLLLRAGWRWLVRLNDRLDSSPLGDLIGVICLFGMLWAFLLLLAAFE